MLLLWGASSHAAGAQAPADAVSPPETGSRRALILVGLPGDEEHQRLFRAILDEWQTWLTECLQFAPKDIAVLSGRDEAANAVHRPATKESVCQEVARLRTDIGSRDTLWVLVLGHANYDGRRAWFHLPGPDMNDMELAELFAGVECREQVFWLTHTCSGWFLRPLSRKGRIVVTATAPDNEFNETEFPQALATVAQGDTPKLDQDGNQLVSVAELFLAVVTEVDARFTKDERAPTEHAQLDDDGDGRGTEAGELSGPAAESPSGEDVPISLRRDGAEAARTYVPWRSLKKDDEPTSEEEQ
jgi:hypothetical protein